MALEEHAGFLLLPQVRMPCGPDVVPVETVPSCAGSSPVPRWAFWSRRSSGRNPHMRIRESRHKGGPAGQGPRKRRAEPSLQGVRRAQAWAWPRGRCGRRGGPGLRALLCEFVLHKGLWSTDAWVWLTLDWNILPKFQNLLRSCKVLVETRLLGESTGPGAPPEAGSV